MPSLGEPTFKKKELKRKIIKIFKCVLFNPLTTSLLIA
jgi:hypothetical protein